MVNKSRNGNNRKKKIISPVIASDTSRKPSPTKYHAALFPPDEDKKTLDIPQSPSPRNFRSEVNNHISTKADAKFDDNDDDDESSNNDSLPSLVYRNDSGSSSSSHKKRKSKKSNVSSSSKSPSSSSSVSLSSASSSIPSFGVIHETSLVSEDDHKNEDDDDYSTSTYSTVPSLMPRNDDDDEDSFDSSGNEKISTNHQPLIITALPSTKKEIFNKNSCQTKDCQNKAPNDCVNHNCGSCCQKNGVRPCKRHRNWKVKSIPETSKFITSPWLEQISTNLNACSVEVLHENNSILVIIGCYHLKDEAKQKVEGGLLVYKIENSILETTLQLREGENNSHYEGVFDGKFYTHAQMSVLNEEEPLWIYAAALATGEIQLYACDLMKIKPLTQISKFGSVEGSSLPNSQQRQSCLSLDWKRSKQKNIATLLSSYSHGYLAIHELLVTSKSDVSTRTVCRWKAHSYGPDFPAEVWTCCWIYNHDHVQILSGGDDSKFKGWSWKKKNSTPLLVFTIEQDAGVTTFSSHPKLDHVIVSGCYNEEITLWDFSKNANSNTQKFKPTPATSSTALGGGIWRLKWHPYQQEKLLVAAMHGGAHVILCSHLFSTDEKIQMNVTATFPCHESMVYGADWIISDNVQTGFMSSYAMTCSFYDQKAFLWDTLNSNVSKKLLFLDDCVEKE